MVTNNKVLLTNLILVMFLGSLLLTGCNSFPTNASSSSDTLSDTQIEPVSTNTSSKEMTDNLPRLEGMAKVELTVNGSPVILEINGVDAPITAGNFVDLVQKGVYDGLVFHRVIKSPQPFVAQGGDPQGKDPNFPVSRLGTGGYVDESGSKRLIPLEIKLEGDSEPTYSKGLGQQAGVSSPNVALKHERGALAMARSAPPDSASSQFYIALADLEFLDGDYAVFGKVVQGMDVVNGINQGDRIESAKVIEGTENLQ
ncbi:putative Peptidylprolyl isomerase [Hyella patelloides LEGE 07179]|uniref:Peptidyl-prolyl cis-trans isomerase n=1 Tax=Hyella patelloides LEGE 07179 TaxID=945734 RepID=A0A563VYT4_9CYAN|nr:peptidylprolyl isomerase [Hyella patelloides]VEP16622.1 putative Peptidylprolyl isomerase [Hyella patelloides LEGE 07179]